MNTIDYIKMSLESSKGWAMGLIGDMKDSPMTQPTPNGGNHPLWVLGHLVRAESDLLDCFILGALNRFPELENCAMGNTPSTDASEYPSMDELMGKFEQIRSATLAHLDSLSADDLDKSTHAPEEFGPAFSTVGACFAAMSTHMSFHAGQVADARRAAGRDPVMA
ncbi:MAG: DinB family protein [Planctomycetes bacterium]|nr:DinB family protein [Planctomycetota bacterium]